MTEKIMKNIKPFYLTGGSVTTDSSGWTQITKAFPIGGRRIYILQAWTNRSEAAVLCIPARNSTIYGSDDWWLRIIDGGTLQPVANTTLNVYIIYV